MDLIITSTKGHHTLFSGTGILFSLTLWTSEREVIWWKVDYKQSDLLNQYQRGDRVRLGIAPGDIMLLKEG